jgi:hypothetical protein
MSQARHTAGPIDPLRREKEKLLFRTYDMASVNVVK